MTSSSNPVRTRFAPSPTGYLHLGGARTALFSWAFARHHGGSFVLRIEDTDVARSTPEATQAILDGMAWLGLDYDEGPFYQSRRLEHYHAALDRLRASGAVYPCYSSAAEVEAMRQAARARGDKPRYDGHWRPEPGKQLPQPPAGVSPVWRFRNPTAGEVSWVDLVKGPIRIANAELDDLVVARADGMPTYNFCVVVDDWEMGITHVIRGDDHVNNTPRQINILQALGAPIPVYGHLPMILGPDGEKLSKRHGAVSVMDYETLGYLPEAMVNYLARLGWSHGDDELFSRAQLVEWFDVQHLSRSAAQWDPKKLDWVNAHYLKQSDLNALAQALEPRLTALGAEFSRAPLSAVVSLLRERCDTLAQLADQAMLIYGDKPTGDTVLALHREHLHAEAKNVLNDVRERLSSLTEFTPPEINAALKAVLAARQIKMPQLGIPLRVAVFGRSHTPALDQVLALLGKSTLLARLDAVLIPNQA